MVRRIRSVEDVPLDIFHALRRGLTHRTGIVRLTKTGPQKPADRPQPKPAEDEEEARQHSYETGEVASQEIHERLIDITEKAQDVLFKADTVFPFTLFPDTITLDREKLTVATRTFFRVAKVVGVPVSSISSAEVDVGPFFGAVHMASKYFVQNIYSVNFLKRADAVKIQHLLQGFIISQEKNIDVTDIEKDDLLVLLTDLGQGVSD